MLRTHILWNYTTFDQLSLKQIKYSVPLPYAGPIDQVSSQICRNFASTNETSDSQLRCATLLSQSIRSLRMNYVTDALLRIPRLQIYEYYDKFRDFQQEGYVFMMTYVYDDDSMMMQTATFAQSNLDWNDSMMQQVNATTAHVDPNCPLKTTESSHDNVECVVQANTTVSTPQPSLLQIRPHVCIFGGFSSHLATLIYLMRYHVHWIFPSTEEEEEFKPEALQNLTDRWMKERLQFTFTSVEGYDSDTVPLLETLRRSRRRRHHFHHHHHPDSSDLRHNHSSIHHHDPDDDSYYDDNRCDVWHFRGPSASQHFAHLFHRDSEALRYKAQVVWEMTMEISESLVQIYPPTLPPTPPSNDSNDSSGSSDVNALPSAMEVYWDAFSVWPVPSALSKMTDAQGFMGSRSCELEFRLDIQSYVVWVGRLDEPPVDPSPGDHSPVDLASPPIPPSAPNNNSHDIINETTNNAIIDNTNNPLSPPTPSPLPPGSPSQITIAITYTNRVFDDNAFGLRDVLQSLGYRHVYVMGDYSLTKARLWQRQQQPQQQQQQPQHHAKTNHSFSSSFHSSYIQIALGPHEITLLSPQYIVYHMEQPWSVYLVDPSMSLTYRKILIGAMAIFTFSNYHREVLIQLSHQHQLELSPDKLFIIPIYTTTEYNHLRLQNLFRKDSYMFEYYTNEHQSTANHHHHSVNKTTDHVIVNEDNNHDHAAINNEIIFFPVINPKNITPTNDDKGTLNHTHIHTDTTINGNTTTEHIVDDQRFSWTFFGGSSPRRIAFFTRLNDPALHHRYGADIYQNHVVCGGWEVALFGVHRDFTVVRSLVVLNIHGTATSSLELHRIHYLMSMGAAVVSERSAVDPALDAAYEDAILFVGDPKTPEETTSLSFNDVEMSGQRENNGFKNGKPTYVVTKEEDHIFNQIFEAAFHLITNVTARNALEKRAWLKYQENMKNISELQRAMEFVVAGGRLE